MPTTQQMLDDFAAYTLGDQAMDDTHQDFLRLCLIAAKAEGPDFVQQFQALFEHTHQHFAEEEARMLTSVYPAYAEHRADHQRILGDMNRFCQRLTLGRTAMAKAWLKESLPAWFDVHAKTMDSALAAHLKNH